MNEVGVDAAGFDGVDDDLMNKQLVTSVACDIMSSNDICGKWKQVERVSNVYLIEPFTLLTRQGRSFNKFLICDAAGRFKVIKYDPSTMMNLMRFESEHESDKNILRVVFELSKHPRIKGTRTLYQYLAPSGAKLTDAVGTSSAEEATKEDGDQAVIIITDSGGDEETDTINASTSDEAAALLQTKALKEVVLLSTEEQTLLKEDFVKYIFEDENRQTAVVLYTAEQIKDMASSIAKHGSVVGVPKSYDLGGEYLVNYLHFRTMKVVRRNNHQHPIFLGPMLLHKSPTYYVYLTFFMQIKELLRREQPALDFSHGFELCFCKDEALTGAFEMVFPGIEVTPLRVHTKNFSESLRALIKSLRKWETLSVLETVQGLGVLVAYYYCDVKKAIYGEGNFRLKTPYTRQQWRGMNDERQQEIHLSILDSTFGFQVQPHPAGEKKVPGARGRKKKKAAAESCGLAGGVGGHVNTSRTTISTIPAANVAIPIAVATVTVPRTLPTLTTTAAADQHTTHDTEVDTVVVVGRERTTVVSSAR